MKTLKLIGKGLFSKVYQLNEKQVLIKSTCNTKEAYSMDWHNSKNVFPVMERTNEYQEYICEYYPKVDSLKDSLLPEYYEIYKNLRALSIGYVPNNHNLLDAWREQFKKVSNRKYRLALLDMLDVLSNYGSDIQFEISPRNVAVKNSKLILLDCFFLVSQRNKAFAKTSRVYA